MEKYTEDETNSSRYTSPENGLKPRGGDANTTSQNLFSHQESGITRESTRAFKFPTGIPEPMPIIDKKYQIQDPKA
jgi:hypothetical protein